MKNFKKGYSLFEIMLVLAIIAAIISGIVAAAGAAFRNNEDNKRMNIVQNILPTAMNAYYGKAERFPIADSSSNSSHASNLGFIINKTGTWWVNYDWLDTVLAQYGALTESEIKMITPPAVNESIWVVTSKNGDGVVICTQLNTRSVASQKTLSSFTGASLTGTVYVNAVWNPYTDPDLLQHISVICKGLR